MTQPDENPAAVLAWTLIRALRIDRAVAWLNTRAERWEARRR